MANHPTIDETIAFAAKAHAGQRDKSGVPYIAHPLAVMRAVSEAAWHVAVLHDVIEDCPDVLFLDLADMGYTSEELRAIEALTRRKGEEYDAFIQRIIDTGGPLAIEVKMADLEDNLDLRRLNEVTDNDRERAKKYRTAHAPLNATR